MQQNNQDEFSVKLIEYASKEYLQACHLRYKLFFAQHSLPWSIVFRDYHPDSIYAAIISQKRLIAYGELVPQDRIIYRICQMVVHPDYQRQNLGRSVLQTLIDLAQAQGASCLTLNSRLTAIAFYQKLGFYTCGLEFPSQTTKVPHIQMIKHL